jgi:predicted membrane channel-forming protein YqfA (hemolysin III family)
VNKRDPKAPYGIRAHPDMSVGKCLASIFRPDNNEFLPIWLFIIFAVYEWVQVLFILIHFKKQYDLPLDVHYMLIFVATFGIAASMTASAVYLIFYPMSRETKKNLELANYCFILVMAYGLLFAFIGSEWYDKQPLVFYFLFFSLFLLVVSLVLLTYETARPFVLIGAIVFVVTTCLIDLICYANGKQVNVFYIPIAIELAVLLVGFIVLFFEIPERWTRWRYVHLYFNSHIIYTILLINFLFEAQAIIYYTIMINSGKTYDDGLWWIT